MTDKFEQYAIVELFGHQIIAGFVSEQVIGGQGFVRVDVPTVDERAGFTKFYGAGAIYAMTPCDSETMLAAVKGLEPKAIDVWKLGLLRQEYTNGPRWDGFIEDGQPDDDDDDNQHDDE